MKAIALLVSSILPTSAQATCRLCPVAAGEAARPPAVPLRIEVDAALDLGRAAQTRLGGAGSISIDAKTGARRVTGTLADLGGFSFRGTVRLTGEPFAAVTVSLPARIALSTPDGARADVVEIRSDLAPAATLDAQGRLTFAFGGRLIVTAGQAGNFRGRIAIAADYR